MTNHDHNIQADSIFDHDNNSAESLTKSNLLTKIEEKLNLLAICNKTVLTLEEAALYTGFKISYLYKLTSTQELGHFKPNGKCVFVDRIELEAWLKRHRVRSHNEIAAKASGDVLMRGK